MRCPFLLFLTAKEESQEVNFEGIGYIKASRHCHVFYPVFKIIVWLCVSVWLIKDERFICFSLSWEEIGKVNPLPTVCFSLVTHRWLQVHSHQHVDYYTTYLAHLSFSLILYCQMIVKTFITMHYQSAVWPLMSSKSVFFFFFLTLNMDFVC